MMALQVKAERLPLAEALADILMRKSKEKQVTARETGLHGEGATSAARHTG